MAFQPPTPRVIQVPPLHEFRIELEKGESCSIKLLGGTAEIFGFELLPGFENPLAEECKAAVFTWTGCDLEISLMLVMCCCTVCLDGRVDSQGGT